MELGMLRIIMDSLGKRCVYGAFVTRLYQRGHTAAFVPVPDVGDALSHESLESLSSEPSEAVQSSLSLTSWYRARLTGG
jgi:hypothetical protein